jgi:signal transduction histidine kinase
MTGPGAPSIQRRLSKALLWFGITTGLTLSVVLWLVVRHEMDELMDQGLRESAEIIYGVMANTPTPQSAPNYWEIAPGHDEKVIWQVVSATDHQVVRRSHKAPDTPLAPYSPKDFFDAPNGQWRVVTLRFHQNPTTYLLVAQPTGERIQTSTESAVLALLSTLLVGWGSVLVLSRTTRRELQPLRDLTQAVRRYDPLSPETQPEPPNLEELTPISEAINDLGHRLALRVNRERSFAAHAAHALRTPLAGIDAQLALALRELPESQRPRVLRAREASQRLAHVVKALLVMFRSGTEPNWQVFSLSNVLRAVPTPGLVCEVQGSDALNGDPDLLSAVVANLLDNATRHGATHVTLHSGADEHFNRLLVVDNGAGCPASELQRLRVLLGDQRYSGEGGSHGLGLVLADIVMRAHLGGVRLPEPPARGFAVELYWALKPGKTAGRH